MSKPSLTFSWLPCDPPRPCPEVLTAAEAAMYLRLDETGVDPETTLRRYRQGRGLRGVRIGRAIRYRRVDLDAWLERQQQQNPV